MKLLVVSNLYPPDVRGGYEISCQHMVEGLRRHGHQVAVLTSATAATAGSGPESGLLRHLHLADFYKQPESQPVAWRHLAHEAKASTYFNVYQLIETLREIRPDLVYLFNLLGLGVLAIIDVLNDLEIPWVWHLGDAVPKQACDDLPAAVTTLFRCGHDRNFGGGTMIAVSQALVRENEIAGTDLGQDVRLIPYWGQSGPNPTAARRRAPGRPLRFMTAGALGRHKGTHLMIDAAGILARRGIDDFVLDIYGPGDFREFLAQSQALGVTERVNFRGPRQQAELFGLYGDYDVFLFPSWHREPFGMVPVEAAAAGCPPILTYGCGVAEWLTHGVHCLKIRRTASDLANAMQTLMQDEALRFGLAQRAQHLAQESLSFERLLGRIEAVLRERARPIAWDSLDWQGAHRLAFIKDRLAWHFFVEGF